MTLTKKTKKILIIGAVAAVAIAAGSVYWFRYHGDQTPDVPLTGTIDYSPPTDEQKQDSEDRKDAIVEEQKQESAQANSGQKKTATVVITNADPTSVGAYVSGVLEDGGVCTATFTKGSQTVVKTSTGFANVSSTNCTPINLARSDFPSAGTWSVTVSYASAAASGTSSPATIEVK